MDQKPSIVTNLHNGAIPESLAASQTETADSDWWVSCTDNGKLTDTQH